LLPIFVVGQTIVLSTSIHKSPYCLKIAQRNSQLNPNPWPQSVSALRLRSRVD
jgi:hypothetical protein